MSRPSVRYLYHPAKNQIYEVYFRMNRAQSVARVLKAKGQRGNPVELWGRLRGEPSAFVREVIDQCEANTLGDSYQNASDAMNAAFQRQRSTAKAV